MTKTESPLPTHGAPDASEGALSSYKNRSFRVYRCAAILVAIVIGGFFLARQIFRVKAVPRVRASSMARGPTSLLQAGFLGTGSDGWVRIDVETPLQGNGEMEEYQVSVVLMDQELHNSMLNLVLFDAEENQYAVENVTTGVEVALPPMVAVEAIRGSITILTTNQTNTTLEFTFDVQGSSVLPATSSHRSVGTLSGNLNYNVGGNMTLGLRVELDTTQQQAFIVPYLHFVDVMTPSAPGPYLYLSPRELDKDLDAFTDTLIPIVGTNTFSTEGSFTQDLTGIVDPADVENFRSVIVWCRPFELYLGGGVLTPTTLLQK